MRSSNPLQFPKPLWDSPSEGSKSGFLGISGLSGGFDPTDSSDSEPCLSFSETETSPISGSSAEGTRNVYSCRGSEWTPKSGAQFLTSRGGLPYAQRRNRDRGQTRPDARYQPVSRHTLQVMTQ